MRYERFGISLERLAPAHLERVRGWRNHDWVRQRMRVREPIAAAAQTAWFAGLDPLRDWYFVADDGAGPFGLFHVKAIDWTRRCGEAGGFVGERSRLATPAAAAATLALMDFAFEVLALETLEAQYDAGVEALARFNTALGYQPLRQEDGFVRVSVSAARHFACAAPARAAAARLHGDAARLLDPDDRLGERPPGSAP